MSLVEVKHEMLQSPSLYGGHTVIQSYKWVLVDRNFV